MFQCLFSPSGGPGSGRFAQCERLAKANAGFVHVSMGDEIRSEILKSKKAPGKWRSVATLVQEGNMAPEDVTVNILVNKLKECADAKVILLDGYPRTREQVEDLNKHVSTRVTSRNMYTLYVKDTCTCTVKQEC